MYIHAQKNGGRKFQKQNKPKGKRKIKREKSERSRNMLQIEQKKLETKKLKGVRALEKRCLGSLNSGGSLFILCIYTESHEAFFVFVCCFLCQLSLHNYYIHVRI